MEYLPPLRTIVPLIETQRPLLFFWNAMFAPGRAGRIVPEKRTVRPRLTRFLETLLLT